MSHSWRDRTYRDLADSAPARNDDGAIPQAIQEDVNTTPYCTPIDATDSEVDRAVGAIGDYERADTIPDTPIEEFDIETEAPTRDHRVPTGIWRVS